MEKNSENKDQYLYEVNGYMDWVHKNATRMNECGCGDDCDCGNDPTKDTDGLHPGKEIVAYSPDMFGGIGTCPTCKQPNNSCDDPAQGLSYGDLIRVLSTGDKGRVIDMDEGSAGCMMEGGEVKIIPIENLTIDEKYRVDEAHNC